MPQIAPLDSSLVELATVQPLEDRWVSAAEWRAVYEKTFPYVFHTLRRLGVRAADVEDVTHDVFVVAYRRAADYDRTRPIGAWLFGIALRVASEYRRRPRHRRELCDGQAGEAPDPRLWPEAELVLERRRRQVLEALEALDEAKRAVLIMHDIDGYLMPAIAQTLGIPLNTAYSRLRLAREAFRHQIERLRQNGGRHG